METSISPLPENVSAVVAAYPKEAQKTFHRLRELLLEEAKKDDRIGEIEETLKWGEPAFLTSQTKSGSTVRIAWSSKSPQQMGIYFNCKASLVDTFRTIFPELSYQGNRAIILDLNSVLPEPVLAECLTIAMTYHRHKVVSDLS